MEHQRIGTMELKPLYRSGSRILIGLKEDYSQDNITDGLVLEIDIDNKTIVNNPWSGQKKLKFDGYYVAVGNNEEPGLLAAIHENFHRTQIVEMVDLLLNPSKEAIESLIWIPDRLKNKNTSK